MSSKTSARGFDPRGQLASRSLLLLCVWTCTRTQRAPDLVGSNIGTPLHVLHAWLGHSWPQRSPSRRLLRSQTTSTPRLFWCTFDAELLLRPDASRGCPRRAARQKRTNLIFVSLPPLRKEKAKNGKGRRSAACREPSRLPLAGGYGGREDERAPVWVGTAATRYTG
jgi:hypothetical protein